MHLKNRIYIYESKYWGQKSNALPKIKNTKIERSGEIANWLLKIAAHRTKDNTKIAHCILNLTDFNLKKKHPK